MDRVREGDVEHLIIWPFSYVATEVKSPRAALSLSQGKPRRAARAGFAAVCRNLCKQENEALVHIPNVWPKLHPFSAVKPATRGLNEAVSVQR